MELWKTLSEYPTIPQRLELMENALRLHTIPQPSTINRRIGICDELFFNFIKFFVIFL